MKYSQMNGEIKYLRSSQAHCLDAHAYTRPKPTKELACPNARNGRNNARNANNKYRSFGG